MTDYSEIEGKLLAKQKELSDRLQTTQATEGHEVEEGLDSNAQLWEVSEVRDGLDDEAAQELNQVNDALARLGAGSLRSQRVLMPSTRSSRPRVSSSDPA